MASAARLTRYTPEQYLAMEREAEFRSEYDGGLITEREGASHNHNMISGNLCAEISSQLKGRRGMVFAGNLRLRISPTGPYTYPDVMAVCDECQLLDAERDTLLNPSLIVEVPSTTTEAYDRGRKFGHYRRLASLKEYVMVTQDEVRVERYTRDGDRWVLSECTHLEDTLRLESIGCEIPLHEIYYHVEISGEAAGV
jgi:Uma2 family endonuclease